MKICVRICYSRLICVCQSYKNMSYEQYLWQKYQYGLFMAPPPLRVPLRAAHSAWRYGLLGKCCWAWTPMTRVFSLWQQASADTPTPWCNASPSGRVCVAPLYRVHGCALSSLARTRCSTSVAHSICSPHARARSIRSQISPTGTCAARGPVCRADVGGWADSGTLGWTGTSSP